MSIKVDHIESILFNYETTHRSDFRHLEILHQLQDTKKIESRSSTSQKDIEKRKEKPLSTQVEETEAERERSLCPRSRLVMPPAVSVDDIEDPRVRQILIKDVYTSTTRRSYDQPICNSARAPLPARYTRSNPLALPKLKPPYVVPEWRLESVGWDRRQRRTNMDSTTVFWRNKYKESDKLK